MLVQALAKGDRDERAVEQATEFGVDSIVPWQAARSVSRWDGAGGAEKRAKGVAKWARIAREAAKQSMRAFIPEVRQPMTLGELCEAAAGSGTSVVVLHPRGEARLSEWAASHAAGAARIMLVVGPEGGFEDSELDAPTRARLVNDVKVAKDAFELDYTHTDTGFSWVLPAPTRVQKVQEGSWKVVETGANQCDATMSLTIDTALPLPGFIQKKTVKDTVAGATSALVKQF